MALLHHIRSQEELDALLQSKSSGLVIIDFHATWCPPCHAIAPIYDQLSQKYKHVTFTKVDVDAVPSVAQKYKVSAMPTFIFITGNTVVEQLKGPTQEDLRAAVAKHAPPAPPSLASSSGSTAILPGDMSLLEFLDSQQLNCLNESKDHTLRGIVSTKARNTSEAYLESDTDEQLLLNIPFNRTVRCRAIIIHTTRLAQAPKEIKIAVNKPSIGFGDVEDAGEAQVAQILELKEEDVTNGNPIALRFVRFQSVNSLHIFVASNHGGEDESRIDAIDIFGVPVETTDMKGFKKQDDH